MTNGVMKDFDGRDEIDHSFVYLVCLKVGCMILPGMFNLFVVMKSVVSCYYILNLFISITPTLPNHFYIQLESPATCMISPLC